MGFKCQTLVLQGQLEASRQECQQLLGRLTEQQQRHQQQQSTALTTKVVQEKENERKNLEGVVSALQDDIKKLQDKLKAAEAALAKRDEEITKLKGDISSYQKLSAVFQQTKTTLQHQLQEMDTVLPPPEENRAGKEQQPQRPPQDKPNPQT